MTTYEDFLKSKSIITPSTGIEVAAERLNPGLFPFQRDLTRLSLRKGRSALFATTGMGKTAMQLAWADALVTRTAGKVLVLAPLAVAQQTVQEGQKFGIQVQYARNQGQVAHGPGITITNYEMLEHFDPGQFTGVVLDESGILKAFAGKTKQALVEAFRKIPFRLCCTATPAPNDTVELTNHADFLGVMSPRDMLTIFFTTKGTSKNDGRFRLKTHARDAFYRWMASWSMSLTRPSDLGYSDAGYDLPALSIKPVIVPSDWAPTGQLFFTGLKGVVERASARRSTVAARVEAAVQTIQREPTEQWLVWVGLNDESASVAQALPGAIEVKGSDSPEEKAEALTAFARGEIRILVTKPSIAGFGLNFQSCARMAFVGLGDSYEQYFQALRRCWRFGQTRPVDAYIVLSEVEQPVYDNVLRKEREAEELSRELIRHLAAFERAEIEGVTGRGDYVPGRRMVLPDWLTDQVKELQLQEAVA